MRILSAFLALLFTFTSLLAAAPAERIRVACIGDSITAGVGASPGKSYPAQLQAMLGSDWLVGNFGVSGRTLLREGDYPWWNEPAFHEAQKFEPDVVIIMLGTNDTKPQNWQHADAFYSDYSDLVEVFADLPSEPRVYVCRPCPVPEPGNFGINEANLQKEIVLIDRLAEEESLGIIDMHAALADHPEDLPDRVHPNNAGAAKMAAAAFTALTGKTPPPLPNSLFSDHAVLQRNAAVAVWGTAFEDETITVSFNGQTVSTEAEDGRWEVELAPMPANATPQSMTIAGESSFVIEDVLIGDVWIASGQSNMERQLGPRAGQKELVDWESDAASATNPAIRQFYVPQQLALEPQSDANGFWSVCTPENVQNFTAVGYYFAREVYEARQVPIAILHTSWGGTPAEAWTSREALSQLPEYSYATALLDNARKLAADPSIYQELKDRWFEKHDPGSDSGNAWSRTNVDREGWRDVTVPNSLSAMGIEFFDGVVWFRKTFTLSPEAADGAAVLNLGFIDDNDTTWVNGVRVGATESWNINRRYTIPDGVLKPGENVIAVRTIDLVGDDGWRSPAAEIRLELSDPEKPAEIPLAGTWQARIGYKLTPGHPFPNRNGVNQNSPTVLYNAMIHPLLRFPITGTIWYQGESNNNRAGAYRELFSAMIADWRARWEIGPFPFLFVQIAPHRDMTPELRESQRLTLKSSPNTAMAVTVDVGDADDIHPANKAPVGERLALAARALAYGEAIEYSGPALKRVRAEGAELRLDFAHADGGLVSPGGALKGFEIAGADGAFVAAEARIDEQSVVLTSEQVTRPTRVRYGWTNVPDVNLFNRAGLPASPFRASLHSETNAN